MKRQTEEPSDILARRLRAIRDRKGLTQEALSIRCGIPREEISRIENGQARNPTLGRLGAIAAALGVRVTALLNG